MSVADGFDLDGLTAEVIIAAMAWAAKMERLAINERIAAARERVEAEGGSWGHPPSYTPAERDSVLAMAKAGASVRATAQVLGIKKSVVGRIRMAAKTAA